MDILLHLPIDTEFFTMGDFIIASSGEVGVLVLDRRMVSMEPVTTPPPDDDNPPPEYDSYVVVTDSLNVRKAPNTSAGIVRKLKRDDGITLVQGVSETTGSLVWRQLADSNWVAVRNGNTDYAVPSTRGG